MATAIILFTLTPDHTRPYPMYLYSHGQSAWFWNSQGHIFVRICIRKLHMCKSQLGGRNVRSGPAKRCYNSSWHFVQEHKITRNFGSDWKSTILHSLALHVRDEVYELSPRFKQTRVLALNNKMLQMYGKNIIQVAKDSLHSNLSLLASWKALFTKIQVEVNNVFH